MRRTLIANRARALRRTMSDPEVILWTRLRGRGPDRPTFRRQHPFGAIILDFYCPSARLAVEVDGATHLDEAAEAKDAARDRWLGSQGVEVLRVPASRVFNHLGEVVDAILWLAAERQRMRPAPSTPGSSPGLQPGSAGGPPPAAPRGR